MCLVSSTVIALLIASMPSEARFHEVSLDITEEHFPSTDVPNPDGGELKNYGKNVSSDYILADLKSRHRRAATAAEIFRYWRNHPECRKLWIVALGQVWNGRVVMLYQYDVGYRHAFLSGIAFDWGAHYFFLSFPL